MEYRSNEIKAGCLVIFSIILLLAFLIIISGLDLFKSPKLYFARFKNTSGLEVGSLVRFGGMEVGRVKQVHIAPDNNSQIEFILEIDENIPVKNDSEALITSIGIMGEYYIEITTGTMNSSLLPANSKLQCREMLPMMMLTDSVDKITRQLSVTIESVNKILGAENQQQIHQLFLNLNQLLADNQQAISSMMANMNAVLADLNRIGDNLDTLLLSNQQSITSSIQQLEGTLASTQELILDFQHTMKNVDQILMTQNGNYDQIMENLRRTSRNLDDFTTAIKERPWSLIRKSTPKERKVE
ncbi:MAG: MlaD family protein [Candidatus Zhuqueibacterota bacterium]